MDLLWPDVRGSVHTAFVKVTSEQKTLFCLLAPWSQGNSGLKI